MSITRVDTAHLQATPTAIQSPRFAISSVHNAAVRLTAADGTCGYGFAYTFDEDSAEAVRRLIGRFAPAYVGLPAAELRRARSQLLTTQANFLGVRGLARLATSALDMAAWDLLCKSKGTDLPGLVGRERSEQPVYSAYGLWAGLAPEECFTTAKSVAELHRTPHAKMWVGSRDLAFEAARVEAVRSALGVDAKVIVDAAQAYDWRTAVRLAERIHHLDVLWFEDPVEYEDAAGLRSFAASSPIELGTGEHVYGLDHLRDLLDLGATAYVVLDLERIGGVTDFLAAAALCEAYRVELGTHVYTHVSAQLLATARTGTWCEYSPLWDSIFGPPTIADGMISSEVGGVGIGTNMETGVEWQP
jgi:L-alanine-DL-glutamate epimerase-like enolase superfamily enzyme